MAFDILRRQRRAVAGGTAALAILVVSWLATRHTDADPVLRDEAPTAIVRSVAAAAGISTCEVELASGVRVACGTPAPRARRAARAPGAASPERRGHLLRAARHFRPVASLRADPGGGG